MSEFEPEAGAAADVGIEPDPDLASEGRRSAPGAVEPTGVASVDEALERLSLLSDRPVDAHPEIFEDVHARLRRTLRGDETAG